MNRKKEKKGSLLTPFRLLLALFWLLNVLSRNTYYLPFFLIKNQKKKNGKIKKGKEEVKKSKDKNKVDKSEGKNLIVTDRK